MHSVPARPAIASIRLSLTWLVAATIACGHDATSTGPSPLSLDRVIVAADSTKITTNGSLPIRVTLRALNGTDIQTGAVTWSSNNVAVAVVEVTGDRTAIVHAIQAGSAIITAAAEDRSGSITITVVAPPPPPPPPPLLPAEAVVWAADGTMSTLGGLVGSTWTVAKAINDGGQVVGESSNHAVLWTSGQAVRDLGALPGFPNSSATGINNVGQVVGTASSDADTHAFLWSSSTGMVDLGTLPGRSYTNATGINDSGTVVGFSYVNGSKRAFRWTAATGMVDLPPLTGDIETSADAINNSGQIAGSSGTDFYYGISRAATWNATGTPTALPGCPTSGNCYMHGNAISPSGGVAGGGYTPESQYHAFRWTAAAGTVDIGVLPGATYSDANGVNDAGQVVGWSYSPPIEHAFSWTSAGGIRDLGVPAGRSISLATAINKDGVIVGFSR